MMYGLSRIIFCTTLLQGVTNAFSIPTVFSSDNESPGLREIELGELNFLHTTDTHGWYGSHPGQPSYDADWGDFISFIDHFRRNRINGDSKSKRDLILIDTGDKHDGNGLADATYPNGLESTNIFNSVNYDLLTLGNHELYTAERAVFEYYSTATSDKFADKYVSSNVEFITEDGKNVPFGNKYIHFTTKHTKHRVLALSFIFNFKKTNDRAIVTPVREEVHKPWFQEMLKEFPPSKLDLILVFGHLPATDPNEREINALHEYLRLLYPATVIQYFGGHSHIRYFVQLDERSTCLQSGRFAETVGFLSINGIKSISHTPKFFRRYIDFNKKSFKFHALTKTLYTKIGKQVSNKIQQLKNILDLDYQFGTVPRTFYMAARPLDDADNIYNLFKSDILKRLNSTIPKTNNQRIVMMNTGAIRYDMYKGPFTKNTEFIVLPFENNWNVIELPIKIATKIERYLNDLPYVVNSLAPPEAIQNRITVLDRPNKCPIIHVPWLNEGHSTRDDFGCDGDDTPHNTETLHHIPNVIQTSSIISKDKDTVIDFVFFSFLTDDILEAANSIGKDEIPLFHNYTISHVHDYGGQSAKMLLREYIMDVSK